MFERMKTTTIGYVCADNPFTEWKGYNMANTDKWYFAYRIDGDTITVVDACHAQNMHE